MLKPTLNKKQCDFINVTKITRLAIPGFWPNACAPWKTGFSHQVRSRGCSKWSSFSWKFLSTLTFMTSLDGKNLSTHIGPKPANSQPCYFSNIGFYLVHGLEHALSMCSTISMFMGYWFRCQCLKDSVFCWPNFRAICLTVKITKSCKGKGYPLILTH